MLWSIDRVGRVVVAVALLAGAALAVGQQPGAAGGPGVSGGAMARPAGMPEFKSLIQRDAQGRVIELAGHGDVLALGNNHLVSMEDRARLEGAVMEWVADVDQLVIDNIDFVEALRPPLGRASIFESIDINDQRQVHRLSQMVVPLSSAGQLTFALQGKQLLTPQQASLNNMIVSEYLQARMNEEMLKNRPAAGEQQTPEQARREASAMTTFLYVMTCRDALDAYDRLLGEAAPVAVKALESLGVSSSGVRTLAEQAVSAGSVERGRQAVRNLIAELPFDQKRAFLSKARELNPPRNLLGSLPPPPPAPLPAAPVPPQGVQPLTPR